MEMHRTRQPRRPIRMPGRRPVALRPALSGGLPFPGTSLRSAQIAQHVKEYVEISSV
jgi:hypothetical protein